MMRRLIPVLATGFAVASCAASAPQGMDPALYRKNPKLKVQWVQPDARPAPFDAVMLAPIELQFRPVAPLAGPAGGYQGRTEFPVPEREQRRLAETFTEVFREELGDNPKFTLTDEARAGVLLVKPALRDIVSRVPPEELPGRSDVFLDEVGEATLVLDFADAGSGATLGTATDRRTAEPAGSIGDFGAVRADGGVETRQEVRRLARRWAMSLEKRLEQLYFEAKPR